MANIPSTTVGGATQVAQQNNERVFKRNQCCKTGNKIIVDGWQETKKQNCSESLPEKGDVSDGEVLSRTFDAEEECDMKKEENNEKHKKQKKMQDERRM